MAVVARASMPARTVALTGNAAAGTSGGVYGEFGAPGIDVNGGAIFSAYLGIGPGGVTSSNDTTIWSERTGSVALLAREGDPAPSTTSTFQDLFLGRSGGTANADGYWVWEAKTSANYGGKRGQEPFLWLTGLVGRV